MNNKLQRNKPVVIVAGLVTLFFLVITIWLMLPAGNSAVETIKIYSELTSKSNGTVDKKLMFVAAYVKATGDVTIAQRLGYSQQVIDEVLQPTDPGDADPDTEYTGGGDTTVEGTVTSDDITAIAKAVAEVYLVNGEGWYTHGGTNMAQGPNAWNGKGGRIDDSINYVPYGTVTYNGRNVAPYTNSSGKYLRCCNGLVSGVAYLAGASGFKDGWCYKSCADLGAMGTSLGNCSINDLKCGDILYFGGHVAIVVKVDSNNVYIADAGSPGGILKTGTQGYAYTRPRDGSDAKQSIKAYWGSAPQDIRRW